MEQSRQGATTDEQDVTRQIAIIAPDAPEKEMPRPTFNGEIGAELAIMLQQIETYFDKQAEAHNLETLSFSLSHLFSRVDFLYRHALPSLSEYTASQSENASKDTLRHQQIWLQLQAINRTLDRMAPLCHLLSDVIECLLDTLDNEELWLRPFQEDATLLLKQVHVSPKNQTQQSGTNHAEPAYPLKSSEAERWEQAITALMDRLLIWQEQHHKLVPFHQQFSSILVAKSSLGEMDAAFSVLLDSAGAIFGDILPNFRLVGPEDREEISALLFDLMQQSDQMLIQFGITLEPLTKLIRHFAAVNERR
ncbi:MAG: hypothetical protein ABI234_16270 [Ktedonobacteraceae bacterium]